MSNNAQRAVNIFHRLVGNSLVTTPKNSRLAQFLNPAKAVLDREKFPLTGCHNPPIYDECQTPSAYTTLQSMINTKLSQQRF